MGETPIEIMRKAYVDELAQCSNTPRISMTVDQAIECGLRAALRALAGMEPTETMKEASALARHKDGGSSSADIARAYILAAASEEEAKP